MKTYVLYHANCWDGFWPFGACGPSECSGV